ncbi:MAG: hybrid sensor histidine kinase/response regulator [Planctomycetaceae bacterium]
MPELIERHSLPGRKLAMQRPAKILAVDDNPVNLAVVKSLFTGFSLQTASSGREALEITPVFRPDVVLLDIVMPGIDGYETCRRIRGNTTLRHTKIIMVSAKSEVNERLAGYQAGADDYIAKPFDGEELLAKVRVYLKLKSVEEIEEVKNRTIEVLQHSNRTPLNNIISYAELLSHEYGLDDETRAMAPRVILRHAYRLQQLLEKGEMLASMKAGQFPFLFQLGDLCDVIHGIHAEFQSRLDERRIDVELSLPASAVATVDKEQLHFVVKALFDNAIRFSDPGGAIKIELVQSGGVMNLTVADEGAGIADDLIPRVFEPFGDPNSPLFNHGDGLSLAIAQQIAWAHNGDIWVDCDSGSGAAFSVRIPVDQSHND